MVLQPRVAIIAAGGIGKINSKPEDRTAVMDVIDLARNMQALKSDETLANAEGTRLLRSRYEIASTELPWLDGLRRPEILDELRRIG